MALTRRRAALLGLAGLLLPLPATAALPEDASPFVHRPRLDRLTIDDGLSQSVVTAILQDRRGFLWLGTQDGLNRYDGYRFEVFRPDPARPDDSLAAGHVHCLYEDSAGALWVGTNRGLSRFNPATETFTTYRADSGRTSRQVFGLTEDDDGFLWMATGGGLARLPVRGTDDDGWGAPGAPDAASFERFHPDADDPTRAPHGMILAVLFDSSGHLWAGGSTGLARGRTNGGAAIDFEDLRESLGADYVRALHKDADGSVWVGTDDGLCRFDGDAAFDCHSRLTVWSLASDRQGRLWAGTGNGLYRRGDDGSFASFTDKDFVNALHADASGVLWIGTDTGVGRYDTAAKAFRHLFDGHAVHAVLRDRRGTLWVGTSEGLFADPPSSRWLRFRHDDGDRESLSHDVVWSLHEDRAGNLWIGTGGGGLDLVDRRQLDRPRRKLRFRRFRRDPADPTSLGGNGVTAIHQDAVGNLWIATSGGGLNRYQPASGTFVRHLHDPRNPSSLADDNVTAIFEDRGGGLWLGTHGGLSRFDGDAERFVNYRLGEDRVLALAERSDGSLWIGTTGGLSLFDRAAGTFTTFSGRDGLPAGAIHAVAGDADGRLWLATHRGLTRFDPATGEARTYVAADGLQSNEFHSRSSFADAGGELYFGGVNGLTVFRPGEIRDNPHPPPVVLTSLEVFHRQVELPRPLSRPDRLHTAPLVPFRGTLQLSHRDDVISFEFAALSFNDPPRNRYAYKLEGFDEEWNEIGTRRRATYTDLDPGDYVFRVRASNHDGRWNDEGTALELTVTPPWWRTWWLRTLALAAAALALGAGHRARVRAIAARNRQLEDLVGERTRDLEAAKVRIRELESGQRVRPSSVRGKP